MRDYSPKRLKDKRYLVCLTLLAIFLLGLGNRGGFVLCLGTDGHIALEEAVLGKCYQSVPGKSLDKGLPSHAGLKGKHTGDGCGTCIDIPLSLEAIETCRLDRRGKEIRQVQAINQPQFFLIASAPEMVPESSVPPGFSGDEPLATSLSFTVLLI